MLLELSMGLKERLKSVKFEQGAAPKLEVLKFGTTTYIYTCFFSGLPSFASLKEVVLQDGYFGSELEYLRTELAGHPNQPLLKTV